MIIYESIYYCLFSSIVSYNHFISVINVHVYNLLQNRFFLIDALLVLSNYIISNFTVLQRFLTGDVSPNKVQEIKSDQCSGGIIMLRDGAMVLYGPGENMDSRKYPYEIVLHRPFTESSATMNTSFR